MINLPEKKYQVTLITQCGLKTEIYKDSEPIHDFEKRMKQKHDGDWLMYSCNEIK